MSSHAKHPKLSRRTLSKYAQNELAILGPNCNSIAELAQEWSSLLSEQYRSIYIDQDHHALKEESLYKAGSKYIAKATHFSNKHWKVEDEFPHSDYHDFSLKYDLAFINGNHFQAEKTVLVYDYTRTQKLLNKDLSTVSLVMSGSTTIQPVLPSIKVIFDKS